MRWTIVLLWSASLCACSRVKGPEGGEPEKVAGNLPDIWTKIFVRQCAQSSCHSRDGRRSGLVLADDSNAKPSEEQFALACLNLVRQPVENPNVPKDKDEFRVIPGDAQNSFLVKALEGRIDTVDDCVADEDCNCPMPFKNDCSRTMPADRILAIRLWIDGMPQSGCGPAKEPAPDTGTGDSTADAADAAADGLVD